MTRTPVHLPPCGCAVRRGASHLSGNALRKGRHWPVLATLGTLLLLAACATSSSPVRYHALVAIAPAAPAAAYDGPVLQIAGVQLPAELDRTELLRELEPGRLAISENDHWAAPLPKLVRQTFAEDLAARLPPGRTAFPGAAWPAAETQLSVDILSFSLRDGVASMRLSWSLRRNGAKDPETGAQWQLQVPAADESAAISALLGQLADRLAILLTALPSKVSQ